MSPCCESIGNWAPGGPDERWPRRGLERITSGNRARQADAAFDATGINWPIKLSLTMPMKAWCRSRWHRRDRAGSRKKSRRCNARRLFLERHPPPRSEERPWVRVGFAGSHVAGRSAPAHGMALEINCRDRDRLRQIARPVLCESMHHFPGHNLVIRMIDRKEIPAIRLVLCCAIAAYGAGEHFETPKAPAPMLKLTITASTSSTAIVAFNPTTFAKADPPPPVVPPSDRQQQG
jgi:hypothetical protein